MHVSDTAPFECNSIMKGKLGLLRQKQNEGGTNCTLENDMSLEL